MSEQGNATGHAADAGGAGGGAPEARMSAMQERLIQSELRAVAREAGMHDLDALRMLDQSGLVLNDRMELQGAAALIAQAKQDKPYLFTQPAARNSGSAAAAPPASDPGRGRNAMSMTLDEWRAARAELLRRR